MPRTAEPGNRLTAAGIAAFLDALAETGMVVEAARRAGVPRASLYRRKAADSRFAARWAAALEAGLDQLRDEAVRRAYHGVEEAVWHRGEAVGTLRRYSDQLLMFLLRAHQPEIYREPRGGSDDLRRAAAEKWAVRTVEEQEQAVKAAYDEGRDTGELGEILDLIDGRTRTIHDEKPDPLPEYTGRVGNEDGGGDGGGKRATEAAGAGGGAGPPKRRR
jgi:hypothetical protein